DINEYDIAVKWKTIISPTSLFSGRLVPIQKRIEKLRDVLIGARRQVAIIEAKGVLPTAEELAVMMSELNRQLDTMPSETKFLGLLI
ncbi:hypothetical protein LCGC14_2908870, partial [marine sediment metagenome]